VSMENVHSDATIDKYTCCVCWGSALTVDSDMPAGWDKVEEGYICPYCRLKNEKE
jgi:hypothetical protein